MVKYNSLSKGIADMLITDLSKVEGITIVEREKLENLLSEIKLGQTKYFDPNTAQKLGKGLGAETILTGAFMIMGNQMRIDARLIHVETSEILMAEEVTGATSNFFTLHSELVGKLSKSLKLPKQQVSAIQTTYKPVHVDAVVSYSEAIDASDQGLDKDAVIIMETTVEKYPEFIQAKSKLDDLREWLDRMEKKREELILAEIERILNELSIDDPSLNMKINNHWSTLISSNNYSQVLVFNHYLVDQGLDLDSKMYGETMPMTFGEMLSYYNCLAYAQLNRHNELIEYGREFIEKYPTSMYYLGVKTWLEKSFDELQARRKGKEKLTDAMKFGNFKVYKSYLDEFDLSHVEKFITPEKKKEYEHLCMTIIVPHLKEKDEEPEEFDDMDLEDMFETAMKFGQDDLMQELIEIAFRFYSGTDDEEEAYDLEEEYNEYLDEQIELKEKRQVFLDEIKNTPVEEYYKIVQKGYQMRKVGMFDKLEEVCLKFLESRGGIDSSKVGRYSDVAWDNVFIALDKQGNIEEFETYLEKCKSDEILQTYEGDSFEKKIRGYESDLRELQSEKREYVNDLLNYPLALHQNAMNADIYRELHQHVDEIKLRSKIIKEYPLNEDNLALQYYSLFMAYREYGLFDEARKVYDIMKQKIPDNTYTAMMPSLVNMLPH